MKKIAFFEIKDWEIKFLQNLLANYDLELEFFPEPITIENVEKVRDFEIISVFIYSSVNENILAGFACHSIEGIILL